MKKTEIIIKLNQLNNILAMRLSRIGVKHLNLISLGNSIATGYSMSRTTKPLLFRNEDLTLIMKKNNVGIKLAHFARAQNNSDEHIYEWIINNIDLRYIFKMNIIDCQTMVIQNNVNELIKNFYTSPLAELTKIKDLIFTSKTNISDIIVYNGATGSFLDNWTRHGNRLFTYGVKRDCISIEATLKYIQTKNRCDGTHTQVYLCGVPNLMGVSVTNIINNRLKAISKKYANTSYVEPVRSKFFYKDYNGKSQFDFHYDESEYLMLNCHIIESIGTNYLAKEAMIAIDRFLYQLNAKREVGELEKEEAYKNIIELIQIYCQKLNTDEEEFINELLSYLKERNPYDFYFIHRNEIKSKLFELKK